jgi:hypothetical protein
MLFGNTLLIDSEYRIGKYVEVMVVAQFQVRSLPSPGGAKNYNSITRTYLLRIFKSTLRN